MPTYEQIDGGKARFCGRLLFGLRSGRQLAPGRLLIYACMAQVEHDWRAGHNSLSTAVYNPRLHAVRAAIDFRQRYAQRGRVLAADILTVEQNLNAVTALKSRLQTRAYSYRSLGGEDRLIGRRLNDPQSGVRIGCCGARRRRGVHLNICARLLA